METTWNVHVDNMLELIFKWQEWKIIDDNDILIALDYMFKNNLFK